MHGNIEVLRRSLRSCAFYVNDHDYIYKCRPVDVRRALHELERLRLERDAWRDAVRYVHEQYPEDALPGSEQAAFARQVCDNIVEKAAQLIAEAAEAAGGDDE